MNLDIENQLFIVTGATSGLGLATAESILNEGGKVIIVARGEEKLLLLKEEFKDKIEYLVGDITTDTVINDLFELIGDRAVQGVLVNAGGPPAKSFMETNLEEWDAAYLHLVRWKVAFVKKVIPIMKAHNYGRILFVESVSVREPVTNLALSNSLRMAIVGVARTLSKEIGQNGITVNVLAPGYHATPAMDRLFTKQSQIHGISEKEAKKLFEEEIPSGKMGDPKDFGRYAAWLLSPHARYINGQTLVIDGGKVTY